MVTPPAGWTARPYVDDEVLDAQSVEAFLDRDWIKVALQRRLPWLSHGRVQIGDCEIQDVRFNTRAKDRDRRRPILCVSYRLDVEDTARKRQAEQILYAEVYAERLSILRERGEISPSKTSPGFGKAVLHLPEADAIVWAFPNDPHMPHLPLVMDPDRVRLHLPYDRLPAGLDGPDDVRDVQVEVLRYKAETHCAARFDLSWGPERAPQTTTVFGKTFAADRAADIYRQMEAVWKKSLVEPKAFTLGRPLGFAPDVNTVWQASLSGQPLLEAISGGNRDQVLRRAGTALAILHETEPVSDVTVGLADQLVEMQAQLAALTEAFPQARHTLEPIAARVRVDASAFKPVAETLVHGDFLAKNLELNDGRIVVCDFDDFVVGDPAQDVARFLVDLYFFEGRDAHEVTLRQRDASVVNAMGRVFTEAYRARARWKLTDVALRWHWRVQLIAKFYHYCKRQHLRPGFERDFEEMLTLAE